MSNPLGNRNLLLGILALQKEFISEAALVAALKVWVADKSKGLAQILREQKALSENHHALLEENVDAHVARHGNDAAKSLAAVSAVGAVRKALEQIADTDLQASLAQVGTKASAPPAAPAAVKPLSVVPVAEVKPAQPKPNIKNRPNGVPVWMFLAGGAAIGMVIAMVCVAAIVAIFFVLRDNNPIVQGKPRAEEKPKEVEKGVNRQPPIKEATPVPVVPVKVNPPVDTEPPPVGRKPTEVVGDAQWRIDGDELVVNNPSLKRAYLYFGSKEWTDYDLTFETKSEARTAGTIALFRAANPSNHYGMSLGAFLGKKHTLYRVEDGKLTYDVPHVEEPFKLKQWYKVRIEARGAQFQCFMDDEKAFDYTNNAHAKGQVAVGATPEGIARWKNIKVTAPGGKVLWEGLPDVSGTGGTPAVPPVLAPVVAAAGFVPLFNGKDLTGWNQPKPFDGGWRVDQGVLIGAAAPNRSIRLHTATKFKDFHLRAEVRSGDKTHASIGFRSADGVFHGYNASMISLWPPGAAAGGVRVGIINASTGKKGYTLPRLGAETKIPPGEWFHLEVIAEGDRMTLLVNGKKATDTADANIPDAGVICLGLMGMETVEFRKIEIKVLNPEIVPPIIAKEPDGFVPLFNGKDLTGWKTHPQQPGDWRVKDAVLIGSGPALSSLYSERADYQDFQLRVEARINNGGIGGALCRAPFGPLSPLNNPNSPNGFLASINSTGNFISKTGSLMLIGGKMMSGSQKPPPADEWFTMDVIAEGPLVKVVMNGKTTANLRDTDGLFPRGHIALSLRSPQAVLEFRKIDIKELKPAVPPPIVAVLPPVRPATDGFVPLFNGRDLTGWTPHDKLPGKWRVENGSLIGSGVPGNPPGFLHTERPQATDFHLRVEAKVSDRGSGAVYFRCPDDRLVGYLAPINSTPTVPVLLTGSLRVSVPGINRQLVQVFKPLVPTDQWFTMEVLAVGTRLVVKVNGQTTADIVDENLVARGHVALHSGNGAIEFRKVEIKELKPVQAGGFRADVPASNLAKWRVEAGALVTDQLKGPMSIYFGDPSWTDYDFSVDAMRTAGDGQFGLWFRRPVGGNDGYFFGIGATRGTFHFAGRMKTGENGARAPLLVPDVKPIEGDRWYNAKVSVRGDKAHCYLDGVKLFMVDLEQIPAGAPGLRTWFTGYRFKNLKVAAPDGTVLLQGMPDLDAAPPPLPALVLPAAGEFVPLFNGKDLIGWKTFGNQKNDWHVENGILAGSGNSASRLHSPRGDYRNFHLRVEARISDQSAGTVVVRAPFSTFKGYDAKINSTHPAANKTGSLEARVPGRPTNLVSVKESPVPFGQWFTMEVIALDDRIAVIVNGKTTADYLGVDKEYAAGHIALHHLAKSTIEFRKIEVKEFPGARPAVGIAKDRVIELKPVGVYIGVGSTLLQTDPLYRGQKISKTFLYPMEAGKTYQIDHKSKAFDCYLYLEDPDGKLVTEDDDGGDGLDSRIVHKATKTGKYRIVATSLLGQSTGAFLLSIREIGGAPIAKLPPADDFVPLFNGKDLTGWKAHPKFPGNWRVVNNVLAGFAPKPGFLATTRTNYKDFHLRMETRFSANRISGSGSVLYRSSLELLGYESLINDPNQVTGRTYVKGKEALRDSGGVGVPVPASEWCTLEIITEGERVQVKVNGKTTTDFIDKEREFTSGQIILRHVADALLEFRKIEIREGGQPLVAKGAKEIDPPLPKGANGFVPLFNGQDLAGWKTNRKPPGDWRVINGVLTGAGPNLRELFTSRDDYGDFHLRLEGRINDDGSSAVVFRYPFGPPDSINPRLGGYLSRVSHSPKDLAKTGSLTVYESTGTKSYSVKEPLVPAGQWFTLEIIAVGNQVEVKLNGERTKRVLNPNSELLGGPIVLGFSEGARQTVIEYRKIEIMEFKAAAPPPVAPVRPLEAFVSLFNGKDLTGWRVEGNDGWKVGLGGEVIGQGPNTALLTQRVDYRSFIARIELSASADVDAFWAFRQNPARNKALTTRLFGDGETVSAGLAGSNGSRVEAGQRVQLKPDESFTLEVHGTPGGFRIYTNGKNTGATIYGPGSYPLGAIALHVSKGTVRIKKFEISADAPGVEPEPPAPPPVVAVGGDFVPLLGGKDVAGWQPHPKRPGNWKMDNGVLIGSAPAGGLLYSARGDYQDFHLRAEVRSNDKGFGRAFFRAAYDPAKIPFKVVGYEALINLRPIGNKTGTLAAVSIANSNLTPAQESSAKAGEWFILEALAIGARVTIKVNGITVADFHDEKRQYARAGHIVLRQDTDGVIEFRKVEIKEFSPAKVGVAAPPPVKEAPDGFVSLFNGKDLIGWKTFKDQTTNWRIEDGVLIGSGIAAGRVSTPRADYKNFHLRVEARISDKGTGGVLIRAPFGALQGYEAPINSSNSFTDKTGSLYAHVPGKNAGLVSLDETPVPFGEWFTLEVIAEDQRVTVKVNGKMTAAAVDVGNAFTAGHIALRHELRSTIEFRKIEIKELPGP